MGMFDYINFEGKKYQTKDTPAQYLEEYEIRGTELWFKNVEREVVNDNDSFFGFYLEEVSHEWKFCNDFDGSIRFYREDNLNGGYKEGKWIEYKALFMDGKMIKIEEVNRD
jgi:hypothetical protein